MTLQAPWDWTPGRPPEAWAQGGKDVAKGGRPRTLDRSTAGFEAIVVKNVIHAQVTRRAVRMRKRTVLAEGPDEVEAEKADGAESSTGAPSVVLSKDIVYLEL